MGLVLNALNEKIASHKKLAKVAMAKELIKRSGIGELAGKAKKSVGEAAGKAVEAVKGVAKANPKATAGLAAAGLGTAGVGLGQLTGRLDQAINRKLHVEQIDTNPNVVGSVQRNLPAVESGLLGVGGTALGAELARPGTLGEVGSAAVGGVNTGIAKAKALLARLKGAKV